jgi:chromosome partitioning protein
MVQNDLAESTEAAVRPAPVAASRNGFQNPDPARWLVHPRQRPRPAGRRARRRAGAQIVFDSLRAEIEAKLEPGDNMRASHG